GDGRFEDRRAEARRLAAESAGDHLELFHVTRSGERSAAQVLRLRLPRQAAAEVNTRVAAVVVAPEQSPLGGGHPGEGGANRVPVRMVGGCEKDQEAGSPASVSVLALGCHARECQGLRAAVARSSPTPAPSNDDASRKRSGLMPHRSAMATP